MDKIKLIQTGGPFGDCTSNYSVDFDELTVEEFIQAVLKQFPGEWGDISFNDGSCYNQKDCLEYKYGKITNDWMNPEDKNRRVLSARANGGWSLMSYRLKIQ